MITTGQIYAHHRKQAHMYKSEIQQLREKSELGEINRRCSERAVAADHHCLPCNVKKVAGGRA